MAKSSPPQPANLFTRARTIYDDYPRQFWVLVLGTFIDRLGGALLFPFFTLYLTKKFSIGMTEVGIIFAFFSFSGLVGSLVGGALTDRLGRKGMLLFGLVMSALSSLLMGFVNSLVLFFAIILLVGVLSETGGPAQQAMVADLLPEEKRAEGFGILRVTLNLAVTIGPVIGGLLASQSYLLLFICDAVSSLITAAIAYLVLEESHQPKSEEAKESMVQTFQGYFDVLRDSAFVWFLVASALMVLMYMQMNTTLGVYLRDVHGISEQGFGYILSLNAAMVVLFQFAITRRVSNYRPLIVMTVGTLLYAVGFTMYGFVSRYPMFLLAMVIITIGEMFVSPVGQAIVASLAPEEMRGRYMATYGFSWVIPIAIGPLLAGLVIDNLDPDLVWYLAGLVGVLSALAFYLLELRVGRARWAAVERRIGILEQVEDGRLTAEEAMQHLAQVGEGPWSRLAPVASPHEHASSHVRIRVSDLASGVMKVDLRLPMGLVNTVLYAGGQFATSLDEYDSPHLRDLLSRTAEHKSPHQFETDDSRVDVSVD